MVVAPPGHVAAHPAARPSIPLGPLGKHLLITLAKLFLILTLQIVRLFLHDVSPTHPRAFLDTAPGDQLQLAEVGGAVVAFAVLVVPGLAALGFVGWPVGLLAVDA
jgi:hypothetical protein